jgi:hypothetical protein
MDCQDTMDVELSDWAVQLLEAINTNPQVVNHSQRLADVLSSVPESISYADIENGTRLPNIRFFTSQNRPDCPLIPCYHTRLGNWVRAGRALVLIPVQHPLRRSPSQRQ